MITNTLKQDWNRAHLPVFHENEVFNLALPTLDPNLDLDLCPNLELDLNEYLDFRYFDFNDEDFDAFML